MALNISRIFQLYFVFHALSSGSLITVAQLSSNSLENSPISYLDAIVGGTILLPCEISSEIRADNSILVLFYRGENKTPIYSVDFRGSSLARGIHWSAEYLGERSLMKTDERGSGLVLKSVQLDDAGLYRCRVDFEASPTRNSRIQLRVIEPPRRIGIVSSHEGERRTSDVMGPYPEGAEITLSCQVIGGKPPPKVTWWQEGSLLDGISEVRSGGVTRNSLHLPRLTRADLLKVLTCQAVNSNLTSPLTKAVTIDLAYPPSTIRITSTYDILTGSKVTPEPQVINPKVPMVVTCAAGEKCPLECKVDGSRPPPLVTWKSNGRTLESEFQTISSPPGAKGDGSLEDSSFYSTLMLTAGATDNGAIISCRATSPALPNQAIEDSVKLNVLYKPRLKLRVKDRVDLKNVEENEDVEFECYVDANPIVSQIQWTRNWIPLVENSSAGIHITSEASTLRLKNVTQRLSGHYACAAANSRGSGTSNVMQLSIKFAPKCSANHVTSVGVGKDESANITCRVTAHPVATIFRWAFNTSHELVDIPFDHQIEKNDSSNTISYNPRSPFDFGDLLCWASNSVGTMKEPCVIKVLPIDKPEGVRACKVSSSSSSGASGSSGSSSSSGSNDSSGSSNGVVTIKCLPGWDGGLPQTFTLEVRKSAQVHARVLAALQHSSDPVFSLRNLLPGEEYLLTVTSANPRGTSPPVTLSYKSPEEVIAGLTNKHSNPQSSFMSIMPFLAIFIALVVVMTTCVSIIACIARSRAAEKAQMKKDMERKASMEARKASMQHSLPPDRGKDDLDDDDLTSKEPSEHYCAVHGHERRENEYISYKHYFNNMRDEAETQHLLKTSIGGSAGMENHLTVYNGNNSKDNSTSRDSGSSCGGMERQATKESIVDYSSGPSFSQRYSDGSFRGLAPLASVDSLSGFSTVSNHSSGSKKTENSSQKSFRAIPESSPPEGDYPTAATNNGFLPRSLNSTLPSVKITSFPQSRTSPPLPPLPNAIQYPNHILSSSPYQPPSPNYPTNASYYSNIKSPPLPNYSLYSAPSLSTQSPNPTSGFIPVARNTLPSSSYTTTVVPSLPPPAISTHPMFLNEAYKSSQLCREHNRPTSLECLQQERKQSRESSV